MQEYRSRGQAHAPVGRRKLQTVISSPFLGVLSMKRSTLAVSALAIVTAGVACLLSARPAPTAVAQGNAQLVSRAAVTFDASPPLASMEQFIPDKAVVIHPAVVSPPAGKAPCKDRVRPCPPLRPLRRRHAAAAQARSRRRRTRRRRTSCPFRPRRPPRRSIAAGRRRRAERAGQARRHRAAGRF